MKQEFVTLPREVVEQAQMWVPLLAEMAGLDTETTTAEFSEFADGRPASEFTIANVITALRAALEQPQNHIEQHLGMVPAGWKLVPVEPTREMIEDGKDAHYEAEKRIQEPGAWKQGGFAKRAVRAAHVFQAMLAAAPQPPTTEDSSVVQPQANQPALTPVAQRKLDSLLTEGYTISGYSIYHKQKHQHGFVTGSGLVGWWKPEGVEYPQPQSEQEPVAWLKTWDSVGHARTGMKRVDLTPECETWLANMFPVITPLYTHPQPKRNPLTDEQIDAIADAMQGGLEGFMKGWGWRQFARAVIEATNNIK